MRFASIAAVAVSLCMGGAALAGDLYERNGAALAGAVVPVPSWTGFYIGLGVGGDFANHDLKETVSNGWWTNSAEVNGFGGNGAFGTVQTGYDYQFAGRWVAGIFFDYDFATSAESTLSVNGASLNLQLDNQWTVGGRVGYLVNPSTLVYFLAGYTEADFNLDRLHRSDTIAGFAVGGGIETQLGGNWFLKGEYRFNEFDEQTVFRASSWDEWGHRVTTRITDTPTVQSARLVLSYKFNNVPVYEPLK